MHRRSGRVRTAEETYEVALARAVQRSLLPPPLAQGLGYELVARFAPAQTVAGDFYDYFQLGPGLLGFYLGDVEGKGLAAAMYAALVSGIMRGVQKTGNPPARVLEFLNRRLCLRPIPDKFSILAYAVLDLPHRQLTYANAGLPYPLLCRRAATTAIALDGFPIGLFDDATYSQQEVQVESGDLVLFFTDGLVDSLENRRVRDGEAVVRGLLENTRADSASELADRLLAQLSQPSVASRRRPLADDASFLLLRIL